MAFSEQKQTKCEFRIVELRERSFTDTGLLHIEMIQVSDLISPAIRWIALKTAFERYAIEL